MRKALTAIFLLLVTPLTLFADGGVLIPRDRAQPDPAILSLEEMEITVLIDNGDARVFVRQVFANHTGKIEEGNYIFALPSRATVSDFVVWDGPTRIPAVILERKRAEDLYNQLKQQSIDPGLLQMGERGAEEAKQSAIFSARIVPIPAYGTKRLEFEYHESIPVENLKSYFAIPLRPDAYQAQAARYFRLNFELHAAHEVTQFQATARAYPLKLDEESPHLIKGHFEGQNVNLTEDFVATFDLDRAGSDTLQVIAHRNPISGQPPPTETAPLRSNNEPGFFAAEALLGTGQGQSAASGNPVAGSGPAKTLIILMDTSLSMQWEKLERSYQALETLLRTLKPEDKFNLILFNSQTQSFQAAPVPADSGAIQRALDFVRASRLRGGTDLQRALQEGLRQCSGSNGNRYVVLLSDGGATRGAIQNGKLAGWYEAAWKRLPEANRPKTYIFGVGDDALTENAGTRGRSTGKRALNRAAGLQAHLVSLKDRPQPHRPVAAQRVAGYLGGFCVRVAGFRVLRFDGDVGRTLPESAARYGVQRSRRARWHAPGDLCKSQSSRRIPGPPAAPPVVGAGPRGCVAGKDPTGWRRPGDH
jgi:Ca-activated chloride channel family protein